MSTSGMTEVTDDMVERAAIALWDDDERRDRLAHDRQGTTPWDSAHDLDREEFRERARIALAAGLALT